jgi:hypothetical protein
MQGSVFWYILVIFITYIVLNARSQQLLINNHYTF